MSRPLCVLLSYALLLVERACIEIGFAAGNAACRVRYGYPLIRCPWRSLAVVGLALWLAWPLRAGQSIRMAGTDLQVDSGLDNIPATSDIRVEGYFHDVNPPASTKSLVVLTGVGFRVDYVPPTGFFLTFQRETGNIECAVPFSRTSFVFRLQRLYNGGSPVHQCEIWDVDGGNYTVKTDYTTSMQIWNYTGASLFGNGDTQLAFLRVFTSTVPLGSKPPATADNAGAWAAWKFDGNANDSSGNGRNLNAGSLSFTASPAVVVVAIPRTENTPYWTKFRPLRAGHASKLDGTGSYSMSDTSSAVSCLWTQLSGPSQAIFDNRAICQPTLTGTVFGAYEFRLRVTDADGRAVVQDAQIGAVAYDDNGVVIYPDERLYGLIGPEMVRGANPWEYADERQTNLTLERAMQWKPNGGTQFVRAMETAVNGTPLSGTVYWSDTGLNKTIYGVGTNFLSIFCGGAAGPANDAFLIPIHSTPLFGASENGLPRGLAYRARTCVSDTEMTVETFLESEMALTVASPGVPWSVDNIGGQWPSLRVGTVYIANGSNKLYGTGTAFKALWCDGAAGPAISGAGVFLPSSPLMTGWGVASCQSDTEATLTGNFTGTTISSPGGGWTPTKPEPERGTLSINANMNSVYYDTPLAMYREWYRSGDIVALKAARYLAPGVLRSGQYSQWSNRSEMVVSSILGAAVDSAAMEYNLWPAIAARIRGSYDWYVAPDYPGDQREGAYGVWEMALLAKYHPDSATRAEFRGYLSTHWTKQASVYKLSGDGYYSYYPERNDSSRVWQVANGSDEATLYSGPDIDSTYCGTASNTGGTATATNGSTSLTGSGTSWTGSSGKYIILVGTKSGAPYKEANLIGGTPTSTALTLAWPWQGDTGTLAKFHIHDTGYPVQGFERVGSNGATRVPRDFELTDWYTCSVEAATKIKLDHAFTGNTSGGEVYRRLLSANEGGRFFYLQHQPFMDALRASAYAAAADAFDGVDNTMRDNYRGVANDLVNVLYDKRDPISNGQVYFSGFPACKNDPNTPDICNQTVSTCDDAKRDYNIEGMWPFAWNYLRTLNATDKTRGDNYYNWAYNKPGTAAPFADDGCYVQYPENAMGIARDKALGQAFGLGGGSAWPAARVGGPAPVANRTVKVSVKLDDVANATQLRVTCQQPWGASITATSGTMPVSVSGDFRAGAASCSLEYLSAADAVLASTSQAVIVQ